MHELIDADNQFIQGSESMSVVILMLEDGPEGLGAGMVITRTSSTHGTDQS